jgi:hypothetical protein
MDLSPDITYPSDIEILLEGYIPSVIPNTISIEKIQLSATLENRDDA